MALLIAAIVSYVTAGLNARIARLKGEQQNFFNLDPVVLCFCVVLLLTKSGCLDERDIATISG